MKGKRFLSLLLCLVMVLGLLPSFSVQVNAATVGGNPDVSFDLGISVKDAKGTAIANGLESATISYYGTTDGQLTSTVQRHENENALGIVNNDEDGFLDYIGAGYDLPVTLTFKPKSPYQLASTAVTVTNPADSNKEVAKGTAVKNQDGSYTVTFTPAGVTEDTPRLSINLVLKYKDSEVAFDLGLSVKDAKGTAIANGLESATISCYGTPGGTGVVQKHENVNALHTVNNEEFLSEAFIPAGYDLPVTLTFKTKSPYQLASTEVTVTNPNAKNKEVAKGTAVKNQDGSYTVTFTPAGVTENTPRLSINLVLSEVQYVNVVLEAVAPLKITSLPSSMSSMAEYFYNPKTKSFDAADFANGAAYCVQLPVGVPLTASDLQAAGLQTGQKVTISAGAPVPTGESKIDEWRIYTTNGLYVPLVEGYVIPKEQADSLANMKYKWIAVYAQTEWPITISFTAGNGKTFDPLNLTVSNKKSGSGMGAATLTDEQAQRVQEINQWVSEQSQSADSKKIFRGWYPNSQFTGNCFGDSSTYALPTSGYWSSMDLYAKWSDKCHVSFDLNQVEVSNADAFAAYDVAKGESLSQPVKPLASDATATFEGWYKEKECQTAWDFENDVVSEENTVLYAKWNTGNRKVRVQFFYYLPDDTGNDNPQALGNAYEVPVSAGYQFGTLPTLPGTATKGDTPICDENGTPMIGKDGNILYPITYRITGTNRGYIYTGWEFTGKYGKVDLNENTILADALADDVSELNIYAKASIFVTFTFDTQGGKPIPEAQVADDCIAYMPDTPTKGEIKFLGWFEDKDGKIPFSFEKTYTHNMTVYAVWEKEKECTLIFDISNYPGATVVLKKGDEVCSGTTADGKVIYTKLPRGTYQYSITLTGYKPLTGTYEITDATSEEESYTIEVKDWPVFVPVTGIALNIPDSQIMQGKSYDLSKLATVAPENASYKNITWSVSGDGVTLGEDRTTLTVSDTAAAGGTVTLTATITDGKLNDAGTALENYTKSFTLTIVTFRPTITFKNGSGEGPSIDVIQNMPAPVLAVNGKITAPATKPTADGWEFEAWYLDAAYNTAWTADHVFTQDSELFAKWKKEAVPITVTFSDGGSQTKTETHNAGESLVLPPNMFTKAGYIFAAWELPDETTMYAGTTIKALPSTNVTYRATWKEINAAITADDVRHSLDAITAENAKDHKAQLVAARDALAAGTATKTDAELIGSLSELFKSAGLGPVSITGNTSQGVTETGAILSSDGAAVALNVNKLATPSKTLPEAYQNEEYKSVWYTVSMSVGGATTEPKVPVILTVPIPTDLSTMAADTIRVLLYKSAAAEPVVMTPTVSGSNLTFAFDGNGQIAFVGKAISDTADTRVTGLTMEYNGTKMGNVTQDKDGNFTVVLPASLNQSAIDLLASGKWKTYLTVAPQAKVATAESKEGFDATYWAETGVALTYSLTKTNNYSDSRTLTAIAKNGTTRTFTVTVKKITDADRTYKIAVANISGGTVTAKPNPAAAGEEVKLTIEPNDGKKLVAGSLKYSLQSAGAAPVAIDESTLTFIMPAGDININAQFEDDASAPIKNPPQITAFMINGVSAVINSDTKAITIILPYGTDLKHVAPTIVTANASKVEPSSAQRVDLSTPKAYRVYASNGAYVTYTVTAYTEEPSPTQSLWEKLQNQINSNPNWWELAEYQKKTGYYK